MIIPCKDNANERNDKEKLFFLSFPNAAYLNLKITQMGEMTKKICFLVDKLILS